MTDINSQAKPGGSTQGRKNDKPKDLSPEQQKHENAKKAAIEAHQHKDDYIQETD